MEGTQKGGPPLTKSQASAIGVGPVTATATSCPKCHKCGAAFRDRFNLTKHLNRKRPCAPILEREDLPEEKKNSPNTCRYCGRAYSRSDGVKRHLKTCIIANSDDGMNKLFEHALKKQEKQFTAELERRDAEVADLREQVKALSLAVNASTPTVISGPVTAHVTNHIQASVQVNIVSFNSEDRIRIPLALVKAAFTENPRLAEYCRMGDDDRTNAEKAAPYVLEALIDLVRRAHKDPLYRNVYLNPKRADQVMVLVEGQRKMAGEAEGQPSEALQNMRWEVRSLVDAIRLLFDGVATNLHKIVITDLERTQLPLDIQSAASWVPNLYEDEPDKFVKEGKVPMAAHLQNTKPQA